jgi:pimeloyl-ACP methyl ester carboxylesterase/DNA-binding winged helix-turn-helix (wHTH) protein
LRLRPETGVTQTAPDRGRRKVIYRLGDYSLDTDRRELRTGAELVATEPQVFDLLVYLIENRDRVVGKDDLLDAVWGGRIVSDSTLTSRINAARRAVGDSGLEQRLIRTWPRKGLRFIGDVKESSSEDSRLTDETRAADDARGLEQDIQFCTTPGGVRLAYAAVGTGPVLVKTANWLNHLEYDWESPVWRPLLQTLAQRHRLVRYDARGNGLSDWDVDEISFEVFVRDLERVVDAAGLKRFPLLGMSQGAAVSVAFAARHPQRVSHLILYGGYAKGRRKRGAPNDLAQSEALLTLMGHGWGQENPAFRQIFTSLFIPGGRPDQIDWFNNLQRVTASPENAVRLRRAMDEIDISELLPLVKAPTLVMHCRDDALQPFEQGRQLAAGIKGAKFVPLEGHNHIILEDDPSWNRFLDEIEGFLRR